MKHMNNWLQFFAEGTAETNGAAGENAAAAGQEMNQDTGSRTQGTDAAAAFTWEDVLARDDMKQHISEIVSQRVGDIRNGISR